MMRRNRRIKRERRRIEVRGREGEADRGEEAEEEEEALGAAEEEAVGGGSRDLCCSSLQHATWRAGPMWKRTA